MTPSEDFGSANLRADGGETDGLYEDDTEQMPDAKLRYKSGVVGFSQDPESHEIRSAEVVEAWGKSNRLARIRTLQYSDNGKPDEPHLTYQERGIFVDNCGRVMELMETSDGSWWVEETESVPSSTETDRSGGQP